MIRLNGFLKLTTLTNVVDLAFEIQIIFSTKLSSIHGLQNIEFTTGATHIRGLLYAGFLISKFRADLSSNFLEKFY